LPAFVSKLVDEYAADRVVEAILLTNNATDTEWFYLAQCRRGDDRTRPSLEAERTDAAEVEQMQRAMVAARLTNMPQGARTDLPFNWRKVHFP
jgi:hypothetical protein